MMAGSSLKLISLWKLRNLPLVTLLFLVSAGCNPESSTEPVSGKVTYGGNPVTEGAITFQSTTGVRSAFADIEPDGSYRLGTFKPGDGALIGDYKVTVISRRITGGLPLESEIDGAASQSSGRPKRTKVEWLVPEKYSSTATSELTATVKSGENTIDFDLP